MSSATTDGHHHRVSFTSIADLRQAGFLGFVSIAELVESDFTVVPDEPGVYVVCRQLSGPPAFSREVRPVFTSLRIRHYPSRNSSLAGSQVHVSSTSARPGASDFRQRCAVAFAHTSGMGRGAARGTGAVERFGSSLTRSVFATAGCRLTIRARSKGNCCRCSRSFTDSDRSPIALPGVQSNERVKADGRRDA